MNALENLDYNTFLFFRDLVEKVSGISLPDHKFNLVENRLRKRLRELKFSSFNDYHTYLTSLKDNRKEVMVIINYLTTNVTHFFRNAIQLKLFETKVTEILLEKVRGRTLRIWSAGCATGEEPYTIAIILLEKNITNFKILASDINSDVLAIASEGKYDHNRITGTPRELIEKYFEAEEKNFRIKGYIKEKIEFKKINLLQDPYPGSGEAEKFDCIFCRNVLIYFKKEDKEKIISQYYTSLADYGFLLLGHSESLIFNKRFDFLMASIYQKRVNL